MSKKNILIVAQELIIAEDLAMTLDQRGYKIIATVSSVEKAVEICRDKRPDLILMDLNGHTNQPIVTTARFIRRELEIPVIYLSASCKESRSASKELDPCVSKPFCEKGLCTLIETVFNEHRGNPR